MISAEQVNMNEKISQEGGKMEISDIELESEKQL